MSFAHTTANDNITLHIACESGEINLVITFFDLRLKVPDLVKDALSDSPGHVNQFLLEEGTCYDLSLLSISLIFCLHKQK